MSGLVTDKGYKPVQGAIVTVVGNKAKADTTTDSEGAFVVSFAQGIEEGSTIRIHIEKFGYEPYEKLLAASSAIPLRVLLEPATHKPPNKPPSPAAREPMRGETSNNGSILNQNSPNYGTQTVNNGQPSRLLDDDRAAKFQSAFAKAGGTVTLFPAGTDLDIIPLAKQLCDLIRDTKTWAVNCVDVPGYETRIPANLPSKLFGLHCYMATDAVRKAFQDSGLPCVYENGPFTSNGLTLGLFTLLIGNAEKNSASSAPDKEQRRLDSVTDSEPFTVEIENSGMLSDNRDWANGFWINYKTSLNRDVLCPVNLTLFLRFANRQPTDDYISSYTVEVKHEDSWIKLVRLPTNHVWGIYDAYPTAAHPTLQDALKYAVNQDFSDTGMDDLLEQSGGLVKARGMIRGWAMYEYPEELPRMTGHELIRVMVKDVVGSVPSIHVHDRIAEESGHDSVLPQLLKNKPPKFVDLSAIPRTRFDPDYLGIRQY